MVIKKLKHLSIFAVIIPMLILVGGVATLLGIV